MFNIELELEVVPLFIILYIFFMYLNNNTHKLYLKSEDKEFEEQVDKEKKWETKNKKKTIKYLLILILTGIVLFFIGEKLGTTLENLCNIFKISQTIVGILLGFITSIPELITFFESQKHHKKVKNDMLGVVEATNNLLTSNIINLFVIQTIGVVLINIIK